MDLFGVIRDIETLGLYQVILPVEQFTHRPVQLPGNLYTAGPVIGVCNRGIPSLGQSGGFGIKYQVHGSRFFSGCGSEYKNSHLPAAGKGEFSAVINEP